jgi:hypothetical protein
VHLLLQNRACSLELTCQIGQLFSNVFSLTTNQRTGLSVMAVLQAVIEIILLHIALFGTPKCNAALHSAH